MAGTLQGFDRGGPFYPHVILYISTIHGIMDIAWRGATIIGKDLIAKEKELFERTSKGENCQKETEEIRLKKENLITMSRPDLWVRIESTEKLHIPFGTGPQLQSITEPEYLQIDLDGLALEFTNNRAYNLQYSLIAASHLLISAYDATANIRSQDPMWEFLRHCRNAAAHNGKFHFLGLEPSRPAKWRNLEITKSMEGTDLFCDKDGKGSLRPADPIYLLHDLEERLRSKPIDEKDLHIWGNKISIKK
jgi:hypothetical protein